MKSLKNNLTKVTIKRKLTVLFIVVISLSLSSVASAQSLGYQLATIEKNGYVTKNDILVKRFNSLLNLLSNNYIDTKQEIADGTVKAQQLLKKNGIDESMVTIMEGMNQIYDLNNSNRKYNVYLPCYVIFRINGYSNDKSLSLLQESINVYGINGLLKKLGVNQ